MQDDFNAVAPEPAQEDVEAFVTAASDSDNATVAELLAKFSGRIVDRENKIGDFALMAAASCNYPDTARLLLDNGADIDKKNSLGYSALTCATVKGYREVVAVLLEKGANIDDENDDGQTALMLAERYNYPEIADLIRAEGVKRAVADLRAGLTQDMEASEPLRFKKKGPAPS